MTSRHHGAALQYRRLFRRSHFAATLFPTIQCGERWFDFAQNPSAHGVSGVFPGARHVRTELLTGSSLSFSPARARARYHICDTHHLPLFCSHSAHDFFRYLYDRYPPSILTITSIYARRPVHPTNVSSLRVDALHGGWWRAGGRQAAVRALMQSCPPVYRRPRQRSSFRLFLTFCLGGFCLLRGRFAADDSLRAFNRALCLCCYFLWTVFALPVRQIGSDGKVDNLNRWRGMPTTCALFSWSWVDTLDDWTVWHFGACKSE